MNCCDNSGARNLYIISVKGAGPFVGSKRLVRIEEAGRTAASAVLIDVTPEEEERIAAGTRSGAIVKERCVEYAAFPALPFGGVGASGFGRRNGEAGFLEFSDMRARVAHGGWSLSRLLDPPRGDRARALVRRLLR